jgi:hypothetical protein
MTRNDSLQQALDKLDELESLIDSVDFKLDINEDSYRYIDELRKIFTREIKERETRLIRGWG